MVARLTPDQKAACSSHVEVIKLFFVLNYVLNLHFTTQVSILNSTSQQQISPQFLLTLITIYVL